MKQNRGNSSLNDENISEYLSESGTTNIYSPQERMPGSSLFPKRPFDMGVKLCVHRSTRTIGGNCVEILSSDGRRIILDAGRPLDTPEEEPTPIPMTLDHESPVEGVLISHSHQDHCGLLQELPANWPVYCGAATESLIKIYSALSNHVPSKTFFHLENEKPVYVGPFKVTPYLVDHSAFDAHALMVEIRGVKIFYSGDFRDHGRKANLTERLMTYPPKDVDVLIMEGTNLSGDEKIPRGDIVSETELEDKFSDLFMECKGRVFVSYSSANIDRLVTLYRACSKSGRVLVVDLFSMQMLIKLGEFAKIPQPDWKGGKIKAVVTNKMKGVVSRIGEPGFLERLIAQHAAMSAKNLSADPKKWVIISRDSLIDDYGRSGVTPTEGDVWVWSMWKGYLDRESTAKQREFLAPCRSEYLHSSGHASPDTLRRFASAMNPKMLIPVHSNAWGSEAAGFPNVLRVSDGEWVMVK